MLVLSSWWCDSPPLTVSAPTVCFLLPSQHQNCPGSQWPHHLLLADHSIFFEGWANLVLRAPHWTGSPLFFCHAGGSSGLSPRPPAVHMVPVCPWTYHTDGLSLLMTLRSTSRAGWVTGLVLVIHTHTHTHKPQKRCKHEFRKTLFHEQCHNLTW